MTNAGQGSSRAAKAEEIRQLVDASLDRLASALDEGQSDELQRFLAAMGRFHRYSFQNVMLILNQRPDATRVAGFQTWKKLGRSVTKGEKGIAIFAPMLINNRDKGNEHKGETDQPDKVLRFRVVHVFDVAQTEGEPLPEPARATGDPGEAMVRLEAAVRARGIELAEADDLGGADGVSRGGRIELQAGLDDATRFGVLVHEFAHELLHHVKGEERPTKCVRETEAEAVAFIVCEATGLEARGSAVDYIQLYQGDRETLTASLTRIQKTATEIIDAIEGEAIGLATQQTIAVANANREQTR